MHKTVLPKTQHPFIIKDSPWSGHVKNISQHNKVYIWQSHSEPNSQWGKRGKKFPLRLGK